MKKYRIDNPVQEMEDAVADLYKMADMAEIIIEAIFNGEDVTLQIVGNCMEVFLSQLANRIVRIEMLNEKVNSRFSWMYDVQGGGTDEYCEREFEEYLSGRKEAGLEPEDFEPYSNALAFVKLLPAEQQDKLCKLLKDASAVSRKQGFIEGYKAAVGRCAGNGGEANGGA